MARTLSAIEGCLLGMAVGDAMGYMVDSHTLAEIREDFGPNGLLGYDLCNGYADVTSYTQLAAFTCNGLLLAITRGQMAGKMAPLYKYVGLSHKEWAASQRPWGRPERTFCWLLHQNELCRRHCMDTRMLETMVRGDFSLLEDRRNNFAGPGALTAAVGVGLFHGPQKLSQQELDLLGAEVVVLSFGNPGAFLSGAALTHIISRSLEEPELPLRQLVLETAAMVKERFGPHYSQSYELASLLNMAVTLADSRGQDVPQVMEQFRCTTAAQVLAGALYACLIREDAFDAAMVAAVNHSGRSAGVAAVAGAILGARLGEEALPEFFVECLECGSILRELAYDLYHGCPMEMGNKLFDLDWDRKYVHGGKE